MKAGNSTPRVVALLACAAIAIGSLGPWSTSVLGSEAGVGGDGLYTLVMAVLAGLLLMPQKLWLTVVTGLGVACSALALYDVVDVAGSTQEALGGVVQPVSVGWGLWLAAAASIALTVGAHLFRGEVTGRAPPAIGSAVGAAVGKVRRDTVLSALAALLIVGAALRVWLTIVWSPALTGYSDSGIYFAGAVESLWTDPIRTVGYSMVLRALHVLTPHLIAVVIVQHAMGLVAALLFFGAVRRCGGPRWLGLVPAAIVALGGDELFLEHAALSDALFIFLIAAMLYCAVRALAGHARWAALAGLCAGLGVWDRGAGLAMIAVIALWLAFSAGRPSRRSLAVGALSLAVALATVGVYAGWRSAASDMPGLLTSNNAWNLYSRVAPWADCDKFTPPPGSEGLCETTPVSQRGHRSGEEYVYRSDYPAQRLFGPPYHVSDPEAMELMQEWSLAAIRGQPLEYIHAVWLDTVRLFDSDAHSYGDLSANALIEYMLYGLESGGKNAFVESWQPLLYPHDPPAHHGDIGPLKGWEAVTRIDGVWMGILLALCLAGPWVLRGRARAGMILFAATALTLLFFPIVTKGYDYRFAIPAFAPLVAAGALAAWGLVVKARAWGGARARTGRRPRS